MASIATALAKKTLRESAQKNINSVNPFEEAVPVLDRYGHETGKTKTRKRGFPDGLTNNDLKILKRVRKRAYRLDMSLFNCCGIRFGWSSVIGIFPVIGDFLDLLMSYRLVTHCAKIDGGLPASLHARMMFNIMLDFGLGLVPILGDIVDAIFRANTRNAWLLETYLVKRLEAQRTGHVSDPELGIIDVPTGPSQPVPAKVKGRPVEPVRVHSSPRNGIPVGSYVTNGKTRRPEMAMAALDYGVRTVSPQRDMHDSNVGGRPSYGTETSSGRLTPKTKEEVAKAAFQYGARAAMDVAKGAVKGQTKSSGRR